MTKTALINKLKTLVAEYDEDHGDAEAHRLAFETSQALPALAPITESHLFTAACLWEAALDAYSHEDAALDVSHGPVPFYVRLRQHKERHGACTTREQVVALAVACDEAWDALTDDQKDAAGCFDWEFVPVWLESNFFLKYS